MAKSYLFLGHLTPESMIRFDISVLYFLFLLLYIRALPFTLLWAPGGWAVWTLSIGSLALWFPVEIMEENWRVGLRFAGFVFLCRRPPPVGRPLLQLQASLCFKTVSSPCVWAAVADPRMPHCLLLVPLTLSWFLWRVKFWSHKTIMHSALIDTAQ